MQQRQPRLGDILDDYCPRERRVTNHVIVAMVGDTVKQTRCTTCEADHEYKHAAVPRQRKKAEQSALYSTVLAAVTPKKVVPPAAESTPQAPETTDDAVSRAIERSGPPSAADFNALFDLPDAPPPTDDSGASAEEGPAHRRLIRAQLPRHEGQVSTTRQAPDFTIRQPATGRPKRFGGRNFRGSGAQFQGNRQGGGGGGNVRGGNARGGGRPGNNRHGGRNRSK